MEISFTPPDGNEIKNPSIKFLEDIFLNKGVEYWLSNANDASLSYKVKGRNDESTFVFSYVKEDDGFVSAFFQLECTDQTFHVGNEKKTGYVTIIPGGDEWKVPACLVTSRYKTLSIVKYFIENGKLHPDFIWMTDVELTEAGFWDLN